MSFIGDSTGEDLFARFHVYLHNGHLQVMVPQWDGKEYGRAFPPGRGSHRDGREYGWEYARFFVRERDPLWDRREYGGFFLQRGIHSGSLQGGVGGGTEGPSLQGGVCSGTELKAYGKAFSSGRVRTRTGVNKVGSSGEDPGFEKGGVLA